MSDGTLSQEEIDALLSGGTAPAAPSSTAAAPPAGPDSLSIFRSTLEGTVGDVTSSLQGSVGSDFQLRLTAVSDVLDGDKIPLSGKIVRVQAGINNARGYAHFYALSESDALKILMGITGMTDLQLDESILNELQESFDQMSKVLTAALSFQLGSVNIGRIEVMQQDKGQLMEGHSKLTMVTYQFETNPVNSGTLYEFFDPALVAVIAQPEGGGDTMGAGMGLGSSRAGAGMGLGAQPTQANAAVQSVQFPQLSTASPNADPGNLGLLMDVSMELTVELGRTRKLIQEILGMGEGTIIELDKLAGEPVDILVNHKLIAKGEVVVIDENFGVRVTEILSPFEHIKDY